MKYHKDKGDSEPYRGYLGASIIGHPCARYLWYNFRACCKEDIPGRIYRLFETGDLEEVRMTSELRAIGCEVHDVDPETGKQFEIIDFGGHFSGHMDGCALGIPEAPNTWHVSEYKTHNAKSFSKLLKEGVRVSKPLHYAQMQIYMHKTGMKRALYLAKNKDTDELYAERIEYDKSFCETLMEKAKRIIFCNDIPPRLSERPDWWECQFCDAHELCHGSDDSVLPLSAINCRQCCHATPKEDGEAHWVCEKDNRSLSVVDQANPCREHLILPGLLDWATPVDHGVTTHGQTYIGFSANEGDLKFVHGGHGFSTHELCIMPRSAIESKMVNCVKTTFDATVDSVTIDNPLDRYPEDACRCCDMALASLSTWWATEYNEEFAPMVPVKTWDTPEFTAAEFEGDRLVVSWKHVVTEGANNKIQVRRGIE
jgi:hypothetical protein